MASLARVNRRIVVFYQTDVNNSTFVKINNFVGLWAKGYGKHDMPGRGITNHQHFAGVVELILSS